EACGPAGRAVGQVRAGHQSSDRPDARPHSARQATCRRRRGDRVNRRKLVMLLGGAAGIWPLAVGAQQAERVRRVGVLMAHAENDAEFHDYLSAFREGLHRLGWMEGRNIQIDSRWGALDDAEARQRSAKELIALRPDLILTQNTPPTASMLEQTHTIPVVFVIVADPVGSGFVQSLARPGTNATGFTIMEPTIAGKGLELLKEIAPRVNRAAFLFNPATTPYRDIYFKPFQAAAASVALEAIAAPVHDTPGLESVIAAQAREQLDRHAGWVPERASCGGRLAGSSLPS